MKNKRIPDAKWGRTGTDDGPWPWPGVIPAALISSMSLFMTAVACSARGGCVLEGSGEWLHCKFPFSDKNQVKVPSLDLTSSRWRGVEPGS